MSMEHQNHLRYFDGYFGQKICEADKSLKEEEEGRKKRERERRWDICQKPLVKKINNKKKILGDGKWCLPSILMEKNYRKNIIINNVFTVNIILVIIKNKNFNDTIDISTILSIF